MTLSHTSSLFTEKSTTTSSTRRSASTMAIRSSRVITGVLPFMASSASSLTTPTINQSACWRARFKMFRCPMWNMSQAPGT
ncbi:Uncharacterised protein [Mycobacteroides abscessus subsp. abscessus]|nr:Uncharacterised protein [Mycobacteroides abscessus subsp. abscessus]